MSRLTLVIGNKNYSSWSLRPWLALRQAGIPFTERRIPLYVPGSKEQLLALSPAGKVPILLDGPVTVWDSLAICEYVAETFPDAGLWPRDPVRRARARAVSAEMHAGFGELRKALLMNIRRFAPEIGRAGLENPAVAADVARISTLWDEAEGPFLFGPFSVADAMYAPVVARFQTYDIPVTGNAAAYMREVMALPAMAEWAEAGRAETERLPQFE